MGKNELLRRITVIRISLAANRLFAGRRLAVEHVLGMLAAGDTRKPSGPVIPGWKWRISRLAWFMLVAWYNMNESNHLFSIRQHEAVTRLLRLGRCPSILA